ncbi:MAG: choice-of-anchor D domain-containing protein [Bacteroidetes bacterium]|nr:choice-of-anchor D domain-containing protein [Bacteroidota bacterium]
MNLLRATRQLPLYAIVLFSLAFAYSATAQSVVVSEYYNSNSPDTEWTELLVIQDNVSLVGYSIRDNGASGTWQGGVRFRDVPLWRNVRAGTIIVIRHRGATTADYSPADGFLDIGAENDTYFDKFMEIGAGFTWADAALNLSGGNDMIQIRDAADNHIHVLSHGNAATPAYISLPVVKINHGNGLGSASSLRVYPGLALTDYSEPNPSNIKTADNSANITRGLPNKNTIGEDDNQLFWRGLRQPNWLSASLSVVSVSSTTVSLSWIAAPDLNPTDGTQGYLLLRTAESQADTNQIPQDGKTYEPNDKLGAWIVIANISGSQTAFDDAVTIPCGEAFKYRIYAYRFKQDDLENTAVSANPRLGRGRSYNEASFAQARANRPNPSSAVITALSAVTFCKGGSVTLSVNAVPTGYQIQWQKDNSDIAGQKAATLTVSVSGRYRVKSTNESGCTSQSNEIEVTVNEPPVAVVLPAQPAKLCPGDSLILTASAGQRYQWIKDGSSLTGATQQTYKVIAPGTYRSVVFDGNSCFDTSAAVTIMQRTVNYVAVKDTLDFGRLDDCTSGKIDSIFLKNTGADTIRIERAAPGTGFSWVTPSNSIIIPPGKQAALTFRFTPPGSGNFTAAVDITAQPCSAALRLYLVGSKEKAAITASLQEVNFGTNLSCVSNLKDTVITVRNKSAFPLKLQGQIVSSPYSIASQSFPVDIAPMDSLRLTLRYDPTIDGTFASTLQLPFISGACLDTLRIDLQGVRTTPKLGADISSLSFLPLLGCENERDTAITVRNNGIIPVTISAQPANANFRFINIPLTIKPGEEQSLVIRFSPAYEGSISINLPIIINPCNRTGFEIQVSGSKQGTAFALSADTLYFGTIVSCTGIDSLKQKIGLRVLGAATGARLLTALTDAPFAATFNPGITVQDNDSLGFSFVPTADGDFIGKTELTFDPCGIKKTLFLRGRRASVATVLSSSEIDFGNVETGKTLTRQFTLRNSGTVDISVEARNIALPFRLISSSPPLPALLPKDSILVLTLEYAPTSEYRDSAVADIVIVQPCLETHGLTLLGVGTSSTLPPDTSAITGLLTIKGTSAELGSIVSLPIILTSDSLGFAQISSLSFEVYFNGSMLMPRSITAGNDLASGFAAQFTENKPGHLTIEIADPTFTATLKAGGLALLNCEVLLGDAIATPLIISSPHVMRSGRDIRIAIAAPDTFTLIGVCPPQERIISLGKSPSLALKVSGGTIEIVADIPTNDFTALKLYDNTGRAVATLLEGELAVGTHSLFIGENILESGMYFLTLRNGNTALTRQFTIIK